MSSRTLVALLALVLAPVLLDLGCGDDDDVCTEVVTGVEVTPDAHEVEVAHTLPLQAAVHGGCGDGLRWYVNGVEGGNATLGTVTQTDPVTYTAPDVIPGAASIAVKAVSREDETQSGSCLVTVVFTTLFVNSVAGIDADGRGMITKPYKSLTYALARADSGHKVYAEEGIYSEANGEEFPLDVYAGVSLVGENWETTMIRRGGVAPTGSIAVRLMGDNASARKFTLVVENPDVYKWNRAVEVFDCAGAWLDSVRCTQQLGYVFIRLERTVDAAVTNCSCAVGGEGGSRGLEMVDGNSGTLVDGCTFGGFMYGAFLQKHCDALFSDCTFENNDTGVRLTAVPADPPDDPNPDFGGGSGSSPGGNVIQNSATCGMTNSTANIIYAKYNTWTNNQVRTCNDGGGDIITD